MTEEEQLSAGLVVEVYLGQGKKNITVTGTRKKVEL